jgi:UTP--glucose-1-phosphate uridylyltransferase
VVQLETAMGAAIGVFEGAGALRVPRSRFTPVKTTSDLLVVRSDAYRLGLGDDWTVSTARDDPPVVSLDPDYYKMMGDFEPRFPSGPPSLVECERLTVSGDVTFGANVVVRGAAKVEGPRKVADGEVLIG